MIWHEVPIYSIWIDFTRPSKIIPSNICCFGHLPGIEEIPGSDDAVTMLLGLAQPRTEPRALQWTVTIVAAGRR